MKINSNVNLVIFLANAKIHCEMFSSKYKLVLLEERGDESLEKQPVVWDVLYMYILIL